MEQAVLNEFYNIISQNKIDLFELNASRRTEFITVVLENIYKEHNASAVLRTCDCFGIQNLHTIEKNNEYKIQKEIAQGAGKWVNLFSYSSKKNQPTTVFPN